MNIILIIVLCLIAYLFIGTYTAYKVVYLNKIYYKSMNIENEKKFFSMYMWCQFSWPIAIFAIFYHLIYFYNFTYNAESHIKHLKAYFAYSNKQCEQDNNNKLQE
jgi:hypothetical protein